MFSAAPNPYDELVGKATDENLASEDWALNIEICDKVSGDGQNGARNAIGALQKRLSHRNPNVQLYALELANTLAQNCGKPLFEEMSSRNWTAALDRLINDRATAGPVKKKALSYVKAWAKQFEDTGDPNLGIMGELYDQLRAKNFTFDEPEPVPEDREELRRRQEDEELQRVLELSKQDKGGRNAYAPYQPSAPGAGSSSSAAATGGSSSTANAHANANANVNAYPSVTSHHAQQPATSQPLPPAPQEPEPVLDLSTATRVRALYTFTSAEVGELNFERGDVIKVLDRGFKEWWRGACNGKIGIFPVTYVEAIAEPTPRELQEEAQEEARVFASLGLVDQLLQTLKSIDPSRGDRLDDRPEIEEMYQASVGLQGQINALIKKYSDQKAELEHMNANFLRAMRQYEELRNPVPQQMGQQAYGAQPDPYAQYAQYPQQQQQQPYPQQAQQSQQYPQQQYQQEYQQQQPQHQPQPVLHQAFPQAQPAHPAPGQSSPPHPNGPSAAHGQAGAGGYYQQSAPSSTSVHQVPPSGAPGYPPQSPPRQNSEPGAAGIGAGAPLTEEQHRAQWDAYYRQQAEHQAQGQGYPTQPYPEQQYAAPQYSNPGGPTAPQDIVPQQGYGQSPYPPAPAHDAGGPAPAYGAHGAHQGVEGVTQGMGRMGVQQ